MAPEPLPVAANRAAITNSLSLLSAKQSSILASMNLVSPSTTSTSAPRSRVRSNIPSNEDSENEIYSETTGVGYTRKSEKEKTAADDSLRGRILGKRRGEVGGWAAKKAKEESSDEEEGRGSLGKEKKMKKRKREVVEDESVGVDSAGGDDLSKGVDQEAKIKDVDQDAVVKEDEAGTATPDIQGRDGTVPSKRKKKNKNKKKKSHKDAAV